MGPLNNSFEMIIEEEQKDINENKINFSEKKEENKNDNMQVDDYYSINRQEKTEKKRNNRRSETQYSNNKFNYGRFGIFRNLI